MDVAQPTVVVLDVNETLTDMSPLRERFVELGVSGSMFDAWFAATLRDGFAVTAAGGYAEFAVVARHTVTRLLTSQLEDPSEAAAGAEHVLAGLPELDVHADVTEGLRRLHRAGVRLVTLTNGATAMSDGALDRAGVLDLLEQRLSVADAGRWKPAPEPYAFAARAVGAPPATLALVAAHPWDVDGAARAGLIGAWLDRDGSDYPPYMTEPAVTASSMPALADRLLGL